MTDDPHGHIPPRPPEPTPSDELRKRILEALGDKTLTTADIAQALDVHYSTLSGQLHTMKFRGLITARAITGLRSRPLNVWTAAKKEA